MANVEIEISDLRLVINRILDRIEQDGRGVRIKLSEDDYWDVSSAERYDFTKVPQNFEHGQLRDDWQFLLSILADVDHAVAPMLLHVAPLLRCIAERVRE
jgi:hypothetical protein